MTMRDPLTRRSRLSLAMLGCTAIATMAILWLADWRSAPIVAKPAEAEPAPMPRLAEPVPLYADTEPARNPVRLSLQDDGRKVLGWVSGTKDFKGKPVFISVDGKAHNGEVVNVQAGNVFTWDYKLEKPTSVAFIVDCCYPNCGFPEGSITVAPAVGEKTPTVFFIVDRTAYRPTQALNFVGFLRRLNPQGEFEPIANTEVNVELVSQQKQTKAYKSLLKSDENGKVSGSYVFSDADALDTYALQIAGFKGSARLLLGEYRKSKIKLKITGDVKDEKLDLKFETVDFLDKAVPARKLSFTAQVVEKKKADATHALKAEDFAYYAPSTDSTFEMDELDDEDRLLWIADNVMPQHWNGTGQAVVAQFNNDMALNGTEPGKYTIDLKKEWKLGHFTILVQGVVTDANGREQRATQTISLACEKPGAKAKLELAKEIYAAGEKFVAHLKAEDGKPVDGATSLVVMKLSPAPVTYVNDLYGFGPYGGMNIYNYMPQYQFSSARHPRRLWNYIPQQESAKRTLVTAIPMRHDIANVKLTEPGAYKLIAVTHYDDGRTSQTEAGCVVKFSEDLNPFALKLDKDEIGAGENLKGTIYSRYRGARVLLTVRDSGGLRFWKRLTLDDKGIARLDEKLPAELQYGVTVEVHYLDAKDINHVVGRFVRVNPLDRMINVTATMKDEVKPGEIVKIDLQADRREEVDLVVSVYDQSLLGINPDKSVDIRNFYLADERVRTIQASDLVRRKLGELTLETVVKRAEEMIKGDPRPGDPALDELRQLVTLVRQNKVIYSTQLVALMRLGGVEIHQHPSWTAYHGQIWTYQVGDNLKIPLRKVIEHKHGEYHLVFGVAGDSLMVHEMHPSWVNINPMAYGGRYYGRYPFSPYYFNRTSGQQMGGLNYFSTGAMNGRGGARGDAAWSMSANSSNSFIPEGQGFISHLPGQFPQGAQGAPIALINTDNDQGHIDVRRNFSDSAYWNAGVRTDKDGKASVEFKVPDSLTNWQVVVTAVSKKMHVGQAKSRFRTFKPVMIWPMLPRTFTEGDVVELFGAVHNRTDKAQEIKVRLKVENGEILTKEEKTVLVEAKSSVNVYWTFRAKLSGYTQLLMTADSEGGSDASLKRLPVTRAAAEQIITKSGQVRDGATFTIPENVDLSSARLEISFAPSLAADMADTLNFLVDYPYGCVEQTMSRFLPAIKVAQILKQYQVDHPELNKKLPNCVAGGIKRLLELQQPDGGWGWHGGTQTHEMMTPYALYGLLQAEKAGYVIPNEQAIQRGLQRLKVFIDSMNENQAADRIYCLYVWSHRNKLDQPLWDFLAAMQKKGKLSDYANALCLEMCVAQDKKDLAKKFAEDLRAKARKADGGQIYWTTAGFSRWMEDKFEITAAAMKAIVAYDMDDPLVDGILGFFAATKRGDRWNSTKDTAMILFAMCDYLAKAHYNPAAKNDLKFSINGEKSETVTFDDKLTKRVTIPGDGLKNGDNKLTFKTDMSGVMYRAVLRYWKTGRDIAPMDKGIKVERRFYLYNENAKQMGKELKSGDTIPRGSYVVCDVTATYALPDQMRYVLMECPKPATAEVIPPDDQRFAGHVLQTGYSLREERLASVAFHHEIAPNTLMNRYFMVAELAGDFVVPPAFVELMYQTETRGHSGTFSLKVAEK
jgi:alpha-2-macroglobulin